MSTDTGSIVTVSGRIDPGTLGITLPHEHLFADWTDRFELPDDETERELATAPLALDNYWFVRRNPWSNRHNLTLESMAVALDELDRFSNAGGGGLVEVTPKNVGDQPERVRACAERSDLDVVYSTGYYERRTHPERIDDASVEELTEEFVDDVVSGVDDTDVRAGIIGEIGTSIDPETGDIYDQETKVLRASARAAVETGAPVTVHCPLECDPEYPPSRRAVDILNLLVDEGLSADRVILCHMDQSKWADDDFAHRKELARRGAYVEFDLFGGTLSGEYMPGQGDAKPSDADRAEYVAEMVDSGLEDRLLLSQDVYLRYQLTNYGGYGYAHILENVVPMFEEHGISESTIETIVTDNPRRVLTFE